MVLSSFVFIYLFFIFKGSSTIPKEFADLVRSWLTLEVFIIFINLFYLFNRLFSNWDQLVVDLELILLEVS
jgi:O-antigen/teichoic acid export membrane protein